MNKIIVDKKEDKTIYLTADLKDDYHYFIKKDSHLTVYCFSINQSFNITIDLVGENSRVDYYFSTINYDDNKDKITINHLANNTKSNIVNHGVNVKNKKLDFIVDGIIPKSSNKCICNQDNQIINIANGKSTICPNLLIDNFDCIANHAAYIGKFKDEILFYLMSRGISKKKAIKILIKGFLLHQDNLDKKKTESFIEEISKI